MTTALAKIFADGQHPFESLPIDVRERYIKAAQEAMQIQDACNLGGVSISFRNAVQTLQEVARHLNGLGTDWVNQHPIICMYLSKMLSLARFENGVVDYGLVHDACEAIGQRLPVYFQPQSAVAGLTIPATGEQLPSFIVWADISQVRHLFPQERILVYSGQQIENPTYFDVHPGT